MRLANDIRNRTEGVESLPSGLACVDLPQIAPLLPRFGGLDREPGRELVGIGSSLLELARLDRA